MGTRPHHDLAYRRLCKRLREWRLAAGLTQRDLGKLLKKAHTVVHKVEVSDRIINPIELSRWASACGVSPADVLEALGLSTKTTKKKNRD